MLAAALPVARSLGIDRALLTCDEDNLASRKVIEANGGVLEDKSGDKVCYWVPTALWHDLRAHAASSRASGLTRTIMWSPQFGIKRRSDHRATSTGQGAWFAYLRIGP
jgi:hypothetical protein